MPSAIHSLLETLWISAFRGRGRPRHTQSHSLSESASSVPRSCMRGFAHGHGYGHRHWDVVRHECNDGSKDHDDQANPDPGHERIHVRLDDGAAGGLVLAFVDEIEIVHE